MRAAPHAWRRWVLLLPICLIGLSTASNCGESTGSPEARQATTTSEPDTTSTTVPSSESDGTSTAVPASDVDLALYHLPAGTTGTTDDRSGVGVVQFTNDCVILRGDAGENRTLAWPAEATSLEGNSIVFAGRDGEVRITAGTRLLISGTNYGIPTDSGVERAEPRWVEPPAPSCTDPVLTITNLRIDGT